MGTVADKLNKVQDTKDGLKAKLIAKGQPVSDSDTFASYIDKLGAIPTPADGSIPTKGASDLTASGATVTVPAGYYASRVTVSLGETETWVLTLEDGSVVSKEVVTIS